MSVREILRFGAVALFLMIASVSGQRIVAQQESGVVPEEVLKDVEDLRFQNANRLMLAEDYEGAIELYLQVLGDHETATLNHNLGIAYFLNGEVGRSVLHFERALRQGLNAASTNELLSLLRNSEGVSSPNYTLLQRMARMLPESVWMVLSACSFWGVLFFGVYVFGMMKRESIFRDIAVGSLLIFTICCLSAVGLNQDADHGVLVSEENGLKVVPTSESEVFLTLKGGEMARFLKSNNDYVFIETSSGVRGWLPMEDFRWIREDR